MEENKPLIQHETSDIDVWAVGKVGIWLGAVCIVTLGLMWGMYVYLRSENERRTAVKAINPVELFPQPRLEEHPVRDLKTIRDAEDQRLATYGWVDQPKGVVRIPIDRAIDLLAQRGLPARKESPPADKAAMPTESGLGVQ